MSNVTIRLKEIDLSKAIGHECDGLNCKDNFLCRINNRFYLGRFTRQWYGLNFSEVYPAGLQFDAPRTNRSEWQQVWRVISRKVGNT